ncbi:hypothetical protein, partial [Xenorhabdus bovienii]|uniref:hypothetical protein n=1 Tax=Xenorhabdus bovienii TaxID=40576 RepID=UPI0023B2D2E1
GCKKAGYKAATYLSELAQWKPLQTGRVHIKKLCTISCRFQEMLGDLELSLSIDFSMKRRL